LVRCPIIRVSFDEAMGKYEEAVKSHVRNLKLAGEFKDRSDGIACCYAPMGKREEAWKMLNNIIEYSKANYYSPETIAEVFAALGETEQAFTWLERAFRQRDPRLVTYLKNDHRLDSGRSDSPFRRLYNND
jgi:tetratricopeptide (TPR) repeat protein